MASELIRPPPFNCTHCVLISGISLSCFVATLHQELNDRIPFCRASLCSLHDHMGGGQDLVKASPIAVYLAIRPYTQQFNFLLYSTA